MLLTTATKTIARRTGLAVTVVNDIARDLGIASYEKARKSWTIPSSLEAQFIEHLVGA